MKILYVTTLCFLLSACSTVIDKKIDWFDLGEQEAKRGSVLLDEQVFFKDYPESTSSKGAYNNYKKGYVQGLQIFCEVSNASQHGIKGGNYYGQCDGFPRGVEFQYEWNKAFQQFMFPEGPK